MTGGGGAHGGNRSVLGQRLLPKEYHSLWQEKLDVDGIVKCLALHFPSRLSTCVVYGFSMDASR